MSSFDEKRKEERKMFCTQCGKELEEGSNICKHCNHERTTVSLDKEDLEKKENAVGEEEIEVEKVESFTVEDANGTKQHFTSKTVDTNSKEQQQMNQSKEQDKKQNQEQFQQQQTESVPIQEKQLNGLIKAILIFSIIVLGGMGAIVGLVVGTTLLRSPIKDYRQFGKTLVLISAIYIVIWLLCCAVMGIFELLANILFFWL